jgi:hypothetical protein
MDTTTTCSAFGTCVEADYIHSCVKFKDHKGDHACRHDMAREEEMEPVVTDHGGGHVSIDYSPAAPTFESTRDLDTIRERAARG